MRVQLNTNLITYNQLTIDRHPTQTAAQPNNFIGARLTHIMAIATDRI